MTGHHIALNMAITGAHADLRAMIAYKPDYRHVVLAEIARMLFNDPPESGGPSAEPVMKVLAEVLALFDDRSMGNLQRAVAALETFAERAYTPEPSIPASSLIELSGAGERSTVRPEDVPEELRDYTVKYWQDKQAKWSEQHPKIDPGLDKYPSLVEKAFMLVAEARIEGAFLVHWNDMRYDQRQFWLQRAAGLEHKIT